MGLNPTFWQAKRVFLTGHTGFKGSWLSLWLQNLGAVLTGYALPPPTTPSLFDIARVSDGMCSIEGDIRDLDLFKAALTSAQPEIVIHMAAQPLVRQSYLSPVETFFTNVMGTVHLFEAVRAAPSVRAVLNITTDKCYENKEWIWGYRESDPIGGSDPYSASKACAEIVSNAYRNAFFSLDEGKVAMATARAGNVIGGGDWAKDRLTSDLIAAFTRGKPASIRNPNAIRPWQHVLDPLYGYLMLAERLYTDGAEYSGAWNFGPSYDAKPVSFLVERLSHFWGSDAHWSIQEGNHPHESSYLMLDSSKARYKLGWESRVDLDEAIKLTVDWFKAYGTNDPRLLCLDQITSYPKVC